MFIDFIATASAAFAAAGVVLILNHLTGGRLPRWSMPIAAGAAMLAYAIWAEYAWFPRVSATLPQTVEVAARNEGTAPWRPWTYAWPLTDYFVAVEPLPDAADAAEAPGKRVANIYQFRRWSPTRASRILFDCEGARRAELAPGDGGAAVAGDWQPLPATDPVLVAACRGA